MFLNTYTLQYIHLREITDINCDAAIIVHTTALVKITVHYTTSTHILALCKYEICYVFDLDYVL